MGHLITGLGQNFGLWSGGEGYQNGIYAGTQDAIYDHQNNLVYSDVVYHVIANHILTASDLDMINNGILIKIRNERRK